MLISIFPFELLLLGVSPLFRFICCRHGNQGPCCASTKLNICDMIGTSFVPSFNVIGQIFLKIEPEECFSKLRVNCYPEGKVITSFFSIISVLKKVLFINTTNAHIFLTCNGVGDGHVGPPFQQKNLMNFF